MEDADPSFSSKVQPGDIIVAGKNFGCGSSREHAPIAIKASGVAAVIAHSFARIFYRNSINIGLPIFESPEAAERVEAGHQVAIDTESGQIKNLTTGEIFQAQPFPSFMQELIEAGGLMNYVAKKVKGNA
jgi:3-isopropylmalate dehydratase small subunit